MIARPAALLLTGGASRRIGQDKATLRMEGRTLAERTADLLLEVAHPVIEVGPGYTALPCTREEPAGAGPLAAVAAGCAALPGGVPTLVVATDLPHLTVAFLHCLASWPAPTDDHSVVPVDADHRAQPLCARYSPLALAAARDLVARGHRAMRDLLACVPLVELDGDGGGGVEARHWALHDVDTPADLVWLDRAARR